MFVLCFVFLWCPAALVETAQSLHDTLEEQVVDKTLYCLDTKAPENDVRHQSFTIMLLCPPL